MSSPERPCRESSGAPASADSCLELRRPYLLFVGDAPNELHAKTASGIREWAPEACLGQMRLPGSGVDLGLPEMSPEAAGAAGAGSFVIGVAPLGGELPQSWQSILLRAVAAGLDIVSGLHTSLQDVPGLAAEACARGVSLVDVRQPRRKFGVGIGRRRTGKRLLTVGTDCALGKKYTALAIAKALRARGVDAEFRATGQTGIMICGRGVAIDAVVGDFIAGAAEWLSPDAAAEHWDVIEGQGSLFHPSYAGVTLGLIHGSQPDVLILCHDPARVRIEACPEFRIPALEVAVARYLEAACLTNPAARLAGVSLNTSGIDRTRRTRVIEETAARMGVPCFDPLHSTLDAVVHEVLAS